MGGMRGSKVIFFVDICSYYEKSPRETVPQIYGRLQPLEPPFLCHASNINLYNLIIHIYYFYFFISCKYLFVYQFLHFCQFLLLFLFY